MHFISDIFISWVGHLFKYSNRVLSVVLPITINCYINDGEEHTLRLIKMPRQNKQVDNKN